MNIDIVLQYCIYNDYPLFRQFVETFGKEFNKIVLYPSRHHGIHDFENFARKHIKETWCDPVEINYGVEDWRQAETTPCLKHVDSDWIWFMEQDFFVRDWRKFLSDAESFMKESDMFGYWHESAFPYIHPCCLFIKRDLFNETNKDFRAHPEINGCDHFAMITHDAINLGAKYIKLQDRGYKNWQDMFHMGGLTYGYVEKHHPVNVGNRDAFYVYNYWSRKAPVVHDYRYLELSRSVESTLEAEIDPEDNVWLPFFKWF